jgi:hypothetical protein
MFQKEYNQKYILYIGRKLNVIDGGAIVSRRNIEILTRISNGKIIEFYLEDKTIFQKFVNIIFANPWGYSRNIYHEIKNSILKNEISFIFIDHSLLGGFASILRNFNVKIVVFFHNIEVKYYKDKALVDGFLNNLMVSYAQRNEKQIIIYADKIICLTNVDSQLLQAVYGRKADLILPITISDNFNPHSNLIIKERYHLFVGSSFFANIDGISWYIENILPYIDSKLIIIGTGMEILCKKYNNYSKIQVYGFMDNLAPYYEEAEFVINPVRLGSGMKTKTIEALMYGKTVIGTTEAFSGIEDVEKLGIGNICNSAREFISCIENLGGNRLNLNSRNYYLSSFAADVGYRKLENFLAE